MAVFLKIWSLWGTFNYEKQKKRVLCQSKNAKILQQVTRLQLMNVKYFSFFLIIRVLYHANKFKENGFFSNIFIIRTIVKMPARDQTLLVLDSEIDHKQLKAYCVLRSSPDPILIHYWLKRKYSQLAGSSFQRVGKKHTTITTFRATFSHIFPVLAKRDVKILKLCGPYQT